ncbi:inositol monophosphatase family protein [Sphingomonas sp. MMS24-J13]|uniref:inositol monophosphatase family protein n=1 Tax=Sphingomonas sp. MMS24-J13 TaxID=3238686 RepID=UPI00384F6B9C
MTPHPLNDAVTALMRDVAARIVMPRFRQLAPSEIIEKAPDDLVTIADRESEIALGEGLTTLLRNSRVVGEEACAADPAIIDTIGAGAVWIVDPIDGTHNFASGHPPFAIMIALAEDGETQASWILDPVTDQLCHANKGGGASIDGERVIARGSGGALPVAGLSFTYLPKDIAADMQARADGKLECAPIPRCAGEQYPRIVLGVNDISMFWRTYAWDHAPGALFVTEAGGRVARFDGTPYAPTQTGTGMIAAATPELWDQAARILVG